jgi:hypothetical protein
MFGFTIEARIILLWYRTIFFSQLHMGPPGLDFFIRSISLPKVPWTKLLSFLCRKSA